MQSNISSVLQGFQDSYQGKIKPNGSQRLSPIINKDPKTEQQTSGMFDSNFVKIEEDTKTVDVTSTQKQSQIISLASVPFFMPKIGARANIRITTGKSKSPSSIDERKQNYRADN